MALKKTVGAYLESLGNRETKTDTKTNAAEARVQLGLAGIQAQQTIPKTAGGGAR